MGERPLMREKPLDSTNRTLTAEMLPQAADPPSRHPSPRPLSEKSHPMLSEGHSLLYRKCLTLSRPRAATISLLPGSSLRDIVLSSYLEAQNPLGQVKNSCPDHWIKLGFTGRQGELSCLPESEWKLFPQPQTTVRNVNPVVFRCQESLGSQSSQGSVPASPLC